MIHYNKGVNVMGIRSELVLAIICASSYPHDVGVSCIINGEHMRGSLHFSGNAIDLDVIGDAGSNSELASMLQVSLPGSYDVINEHTHVHVEYQPK